MAVRGDSPILWRKQQAIASLGFARVGGAQFLNFVCLCAELWRSSSTTAYRSNPQYLAAPFLCKFNQIFDDIFQVCESVSN